MRTLLRRLHRPRHTTITPAPPAAHYDPRAWYLATYSRRSDWHRSGGWTRKPAAPERVG